MYVAIHLPQNGRMVKAVEIPRGTLSVLSDGLVYFWTGNVEMPAFPFDHGRESASLIHEAADEYNLSPVKASPEFAQRLGYF